MLLFDFLGSIFDGMRLLFSFAPFWLPVLLGFVLWELWKLYTQRMWMSQMKWVLLEITPSMNIQKTPLSMEVILTALHQTNLGNFFERIWLGRVMRWFSLEIASFGGEVRFFVHTEERFKNYIEAQFYSQYPDIEIREVPDYTYGVEYEGDSDELKVWGTEFILAKPDPYPIRTYVDFQLDKLPQREEAEEAKTDPLTSTVEVMSAIGPYEQVWLQILVQASASRFKNPASWFGHRGWQSEAEDLLKKFKEKSLEGPLSKGEQEVMVSIEREISKLGYDCGIRLLYLAPGEHFNTAQISGWRGIFKQYYSGLLNSFKPKNATDEEYPFQKYSYSLDELKFQKVETMKRKMFNAFRERSYFYRPYKRTPFVLNTEELATIYHLPGRVFPTPSLVRVATKRSEPPTNLPV